MIVRFSIFFIWSFYEGNYSKIWNNFWLLYYFLVKKILIKTKEQIKEMGPREIEARKFVWNRNKISGMEWNTWRKGEAESVYNVQIFCRDLSGHGEITAAKEVVGEKLRLAREPWGNSRSG